MCTGYHTAIHLDRLKKTMKTEQQVLSTIEPHILRMEGEYLEKLSHLLVKVKLKLSLCFNWAPRHEGVLGSGCIAPLIINLGTRWRWVVSFTPRPLYPRGKSPWYPLDRRICGPQSRSGRDGEEKNSQPLPGLKSPIIQPVAQRYITELTRHRINTQQYISCEYENENHI